MKAKSPLILLLAVSIMALTLASGLVEITFHHKPEFKVTDTSKLSCSKIDSICHLQLEDSIGSIDNYFQIADEARKIGPNYTIIVHLSGYGGHVKGMRYLESTLKQTGAHIVSVVEGDVYSAHAYLAVAFDELRVTGDYAMLFHTGSLYKQAYTNCMKQYFRPMIAPKTNPETGELTVIETHAEYLRKGLIYISVMQETDRGLPAFKKCVNVYTELSEQTLRASIDMLSPVLTQDELSRFVSGEDVIVPALEILRRKVQ